MDSVFSDGSFSDLHAQLDANVSRFAAYKAYTATQRIREAMVESQGDIEEGRYEFNKFNRWLAAEYNTAVARSRTAKQWSEWDSDEERSLFPNIMWLPSRSATLREQHIPFYNRVWSKDDPFWDHNQPGTLWNCKCDWQQVDDPVTQNNPKKSVHNQGLEGNPAKTGEIFSDKSSYIQKSNNEIVEQTNLKLSREYNTTWAKENLKEKVVVREDINLSIHFSSRGIKEFENQNHDHYLEKNELIKYMPSILEYAEFVGVSYYKNRKSYLFICYIKNEKNYVITHLEDDGALYLHSITNKGKVLDGIQ